MPQKVLWRPTKNLLRHHKGKWNKNSNLIFSFLFSFGIGTRRVNILFKATCSQLSYFFFFLLPLNKNCLRWRLTLWNPFLTFFSLINLHCVKSVRICSFYAPYFPVFVLNTDIFRVNLCIQSKWERIRTRKIQNTDTFYTVLAK